MGAWTDIIGMLCHKQLEMLCTLPSMLQNPSAFCVFGDDKLLAGLPTFDG